MARLGIDKALLRRGEVIKVLGLSRSEMKNMVDSKIIVPHYFRKGARAFFLRSQIEKLLESWEQNEKIPSGQEQINDRT